MSDNFVTKRILTVLLAAVALVTAGCKEDELAVIPAPDAVDLSATEDLFDKPIEANPLTSDPAAVIVRVNGEEITRGEILELVNTAMKQFSGQVPPERMQQVQGQMYQQFKNDLITKKLIDAAIADANIAISDEEIGKAMDNIRNRVPEGKTFEEVLAAQGMSLEQLKDNIRKDLATRKLIESKTVDVTGASEVEAKEFYDTNPDQFKKPENVTASHILIKFDADSSDETKGEKKAQIEKIRSDIVAGTISFEDAAKKHSGCPSGANGGSLGTFAKGQMVPTFEVAAFTQEIGEIGEVIETQFGYHIVKVSDRQDESVASFEESREQIIAFLSGQKKQQAVGDYLKSLRDSATIEEIAM